MVDDIANYNRIFGLSLNNQEVNYLNELSKRLGSLTEAEVFGYPQNGGQNIAGIKFSMVGFIIDDHEKR